MRVRYAGAGMGDMGWYECIGWYGWHGLATTALNGIRHPLSIQWLID
jgi:hypothetical protein